MDHGCCPENLHHFKPFYSDLFHPPHSPIGAWCDTLAQALKDWVTSKCLHSDLICLIQYNFAGKKKRSVSSLWASPLHWAEGFTMEKLHKSPKSSVLTGMLTNPRLYWHHLLWLWCSVPRLCCHHSFAVIKALVFQSEVLLVRPSSLWIH